MTRKVKNMSKLLILRSRILKLYKRNEGFFMFLLKLLGAFAVFFEATSFLNGGGFSLRRLLIICFCSLVSTVASPAVFIILAGTVLSLCAASASVEAGILVFIFCFIMFMLYGRIFPAESLLFAAMIVLYKLGLAYAVPIAAGIYIGPAAIVPVCAAVFAHSNVKLLYEIINEFPFASFSPSNLLDAFEKCTGLIIANVTSSSGWLILAFASAAAILASWFLGSRFTDYEKEKAIGAGTLILLVGGFVSFFFSSAYYGKTGFLGMIISVVISAAAVYIITVFDCVKNYGGTEKVIFQDDEYVYYVKAVPKVNIPEDTKEFNHHKRKHSHITHNTQKRVKNIKKSETSAEENE